MTISSAEPMPTTKSTKTTTTTTTTTTTISDDQELASYGIVRISLPKDLDTKKWSKELSQPTPMNLTFEGDGEYAFYRNIMEEPDFPFDLILRAIEPTLIRYFPIQTLEEIRLDDAFCVHYNTNQYDTSGAKHTDPSDITANLCLEKSPGVTGSQVKFYGRQPLENVDPPLGQQGLTEFLVEQIEGFATIHWGRHPHETMKLEAGGRRTNIILTYCYKDPTRTNVAMRNCY